MRNLKITLSYDGTNYGGWQRQINAMTVQEMVEKALKAITGESIAIHGSGRTDSGVHALGQVMHFKTESSIPTERFALALNSKLPEDIRALRAQEMPEAFHSRFSAKSKAYFYQIDRDTVASPFYRRYAWHLSKPLDLTAMDKAKDVFLGEHDYAAFMATGSCVQHTIRTIHRLELTEHEQLLRIHIEGNGFLYNMVRIMVGTLVEIGHGKIKAENLPKIINSKNRKLAGATAPAKGLFLKEVYY
ncbi:MAG: tRNA pseudouridine(38-40) synthase TruA [Eubacteriaceae bacterium]|jgi:tRNA pseudouridine38-40 synthase|nr:tRNA pseudouridine(38-40) synthase TruA [Eubacteriaceae bacterium]